MSVDSNHVLYSNWVLETLAQMNGWVWGAPFLILFFGLGIYLTVVLRAVQFRQLPYALKLAFGKQDTVSKGDISQYQSLMTAMAATMGIGNIAGVAVAVTAGGMGAIFWMWLTALLGMTIKYAEAMLAVKYRVIDKYGEMAGGPMYFIKKGLGWRVLPALFASFGLLASLGGGNMLQANSVADVMAATFHVDRWVSGILLTLLVALSIVGGIRSIGRVAGLLVPLMALFYLCGAVVILGYHLQLVPTAFIKIFQEAFSGLALSGGILGFYTQQAVRVGMSRGLMTSEAGLGTGSIAAAAAKTDCPGRQALVAMTSSFLTSIIMCTITALVLDVTGVIGLQTVSGEVLNGAALTVAAFQSVLPGAGIIVSVSLIFFAFTTIIGYAYYAEKCLEYLFGERGVHPYRLFFTAVVLAGSLLQLDIVWAFTDVANGLMAYPNLMGLIALAPVVVQESHSFEQRLKLEEGHDPVPTTSV